MKCREQVESERSQETCRNRTVAFRVALTVARAKQMREKVATTHETAKTSTHKQNNSQASHFRDECGNRTNNLTYPKGKKTREDKAMDDELADGVRS